MADKLYSGRYTIFDQNGGYLFKDTPSGKGIVTAHDLKTTYSFFRNINEMSGDRAVGDIMTGETNFDQGRFDDAFGDPTMGWPGRVVKTVDTTVIDTKPVISDPTGDPKKPKGGKGGKGKGGGGKTVASIFGGLFTKNKKGNLTPAETMLMKKIGGNTPIKYTPSGQPYVTKAGEYQGKPGQWTSYKGSGGNTITFFNPADNSPPSNFYQF